jgi:hypothetical protein
MLYPTELRGHLFNLFSSSSLSPKPKLPVTRITDLVKIWWKFSDFRKPPKAWHNQMLHQASGEQFRSSGKEGQTIALLPLPSKR